MSHDVDAARGEAERARAALVELGARRDAARGQALLDELGARSVQDALGPLSMRELEVLRLVAEGLSNADIAERLVVSPHMVHRHVANIRMKLRADSKAAAIAAAARLGLL
jgi:ATP/maltotriose-dependent transcriptional regulator MalT